MQASSKIKLKCGTRKSLLATTQSKLIADAIEKNHPHVQVELVGIETQGDKIVDIPLREAVGKEFFVGEIDQALISKKIDFAVHSLKDLSLDRPKELIQAAIPKRENPKDIVIFNKNVIEKLKQGKPLSIGTSAPRRLENIPPFLENCLPSFGHKVQIEMKEIRGNVNTRLSRIHLKKEDEKHLDGVVLALAGLLRLWKSEKSRPELQALLKETKKMILPLSASPSAPGQGALSIECRSDDQQTASILNSIHDSQTHKQITAERSILKKWGGGCHQRFGATAIDHAEIGNLLFIRGKTPENKFVDERRWNQPKFSGNKIWDGMKWKTPKNKEPLNPKFDQVDALFIAHYRAYIPTLNQLSVPIWTSGVKSWSELAGLGLWVEGCADSLGFANIVPELEEPFFQYPSFNKWAVLTYKGAESGWNLEFPQIEVLCTYELNFDMKHASMKQAKQELQSSDVLYWASASQAEAHVDSVAQGALHCCGPGKTFSYLKSKNIQNLFCFPSYQDWRVWAGVSK